MACILMPQWNFMQGYFRCLLSEKTLDVEVKVNMMRGSHTFRREHTTQVMACKPCSPRLHPYPPMLRKMQTYLGLEGKNGAQPCTSTTWLGKTTPQQKAPIPERAADKKRTKTPMKRWFKVRLVEKSLLVKAESEAVATVTTSTQMPVVKQTSTTANPSLIPVAGIQFGPKQNPGNPQPHIESSRRKKAHSPPIMAIPLWHSNPRLLPLPLPLPQPHQPEMTLHGQILCQPSPICLLQRASWPIPPNVNEVLCIINAVSTPTLVKTEKAEEKAQPKQGSYSPFPDTEISPRIANQQRKNVDGDHNAPSVHNLTRTWRQKVQKKTGMAIDKEIERKTS